MVWVNLVKPSAELATWLVFAVRGASRQVWPEPWESDEPFARREFADELAARAYALELTQQLAPARVIEG